MPPNKSKLSNAAKKRLYRMNTQDRQKVARRLAVAERKRNSRHLSKQVQNNVTTEHTSHEVLTDNEKEEIIEKFEDELKDAKHQFYNQCYCVSLLMEMSNQKNVCKKCKIQPIGYNISNNLLPIWKDDYDTIQYEVPDELKNLSDAEKMLIQRVSPFVPLHHVKNGTMGIKGHVCSFPQDISKICKELPRLPEDVSIVKLVHTYQEEIGGDMSHKAFKVRKANVLRALRWLQKHHQGYKDIIIQETNFDWMEGTEEKELPVTQYMSRNNDILDIDKGPAENQTIQPLKEAGGMEGAFGLYNMGDVPIASEHDVNIGKYLENMVVENNAFDAMKWPKISSDPLNEYEFKCNVFSLAFPWLFPGGYGDFCDERKETISVNEWCKRMIYYFDGRFACDKLFGFFALNFSTRRRNQSQGSFFVRNASNDCPHSIDEMKEKIENNDTKFIDKIHYSSNTIVGSNSYWNFKREELEAWISHHLEQNHGPPLFFMTLSCAEYYWPDIICLLEDRMEIMEKVFPEKTTANIIPIVNDLSIVVQEYFQIRVETFLKIVGKKSLELIIIGFDMNLHHKEDKFMRIYWQYARSVNC